MSGALLERVSKEATAYLHHLVEKYDDLAAETSSFCIYTIKEGLDLLSPCRCARACASLSIVGRGASGA